MHIYSWNVNGLRAVVNKGLWYSFIESTDPDIICLQEIKAKPEQLNINLGSYRAFYYPAEKPGYSGTAILTKLQPLQVIDGLPQELCLQYHLKGDMYGDPNLEGRVLTVEFKNFWLTTVYTPNSKDDLSRIPLRQNSWDPAFLAFIKQLEITKPVICCGDFNVAHTEEDLENPKSNKGKKGFTTEERQGFDNFVNNGFIDTLRLFKVGKGYYTWWSYFANARKRNIGWRIDYFLTSKSLKEKIISADIHPDIVGSDHCPISLQIDLKE